MLYPFLYPPIIPSIWSEVPKLPSRSYPFLTCFSWQFQTRDVAVISVLLDIHKSIALSAGPQASPVCPSDKGSIKKKIVAALLEWYCLWQVQFTCAPRWGRIWINGAAPPYAPHLCTHQQRSFVSRHSDTQHSSVSLADKRLTCHRKAIVRWGGETCL